jgi:peptidoglycan/xylan/chitin deacetylase (PgdA/CDA1 family)
VLDSERRDFIRHLDYLRNFGDFISLDEAVIILEAKSPIEGRFFCVTFDDGFKNCITNALPILAERQIPAAFFLPVRYIGAPSQRSLERLESTPGSPAARRSNALFQMRMGNEKPEYLTWDDCRELASAGMVVGSHTSTHAHLVELTTPQVIDELRESKQVIERELGRRCEHFCCPWGIPDADFLIDRDPSLAQQVGYRSFLTTRRGPTHRGDSPYRIRRDHMVASWGNYQLRYFLSG